VKISSIGRRLRLVVGRAPTLLADPPVDLAPAQPPEHDFIAYAEDCLLVGHIRLSAARLTDLLNEHEEYELVDVQVIALDGTRAHEVTTALIPRDELLLVHAAGPRGDRTRRIHTRQHPVAMQLGPYHVRGYLHAPPGSDAVANFRRRTSMVPLTDAWIEYHEGSIRQRRRVSTLVVNRHQVDWIVEAIDDEVEMPDIPLAATKGPLVKDFTGQVLGH
jgi:hypothetical protein